MVINHSAIPSGSSCSHSTLVARQDQAPLMSRWECLAGHVFEGNFFSPETDITEDVSRKLTAFVCPACGKEMILSREEGATRLLERIRAFVRQVCSDPQHAADGTLILTDVSRLETTIKRLAEEAARP